MQAADLIFGPVAAQHDYQHAIFFRLFAGFLELVALQNWVLKVNSVLSEDQTVAAQCDCHSSCLIMPIIRPR